MTTREAVGTTDIVLERETANDESATVVTIHVASDTAVRRDDLIFDIENSKATQEVLAPTDGILRHTLKLGQTVAFGVPIAQIVPVDAWNPARAPDTIAPVAVSPPPPLKPEVVPRVGLTRFSHAAEVLLSESGLSRAAFSGDFITARDVRARLAPSAAAGSPISTPPDAPLIAPAPAPPPAQGVAREKLERRKSSEIEALSKGAGQTMLSVLGTTLGALTIRRPDGDFLEGRITDLVIYEASRLMRKYPRLNGFYDEGERCGYDAVHAGLAIDGGGNLVVCGLEATDRATLPAIRDAIADAVARYLGNTLSGAELQRATFTVTDLSASSLDFVLPLLPRRQSCILGITYSDALGFRLFAGFDHRVTEGREVGLFLAELRERLLSYAAPVPAAPATALHCAFCDRALGEAVGRGKDKGLLKVVGQDGRDALCCASCWNGW